MPGTGWLPLSVSGIVLIVAFMDFFFLSDQHILYDMFRLRYVCICYIIKHMTE